MKINNGYILKFTITILSIFAITACPPATETKYIYLDKPVTIDDPEQSAFPGPKAHKAPETIQAEDFDLGGEGIAFHDTSKGNIGLCYRNEDVDIDKTGSEGFVVAWMEASEWLEYTIDAETGSYLLKLRLAFKDIDFALKVTINGKTIYRFENLDCYGLASYQTITSDEFVINSGYKMVLRLEVESSSCALNWFELEKIPEENKMLIVISQELYEESELNQAIRDYQDDILQEGWSSKLISINNEPDKKADYVCATPEKLKAVIKSHYNNGFTGLLLIGSDPQIPIAYWQYRYNDYYSFPCDLYFADMDEWTAKGNSLNGPAFSSHDQHGNFVASLFAPELIYGRISAGSITTSSEEEAEKIKTYFERISQYRQNHGNLSSEQQNRALSVYVGEDYAYKSNENKLPIMEISNNVSVLRNKDITTAKYFKDELEKGYRFIEVYSHSSSTGHGGMGFRLNDLENTSAKFNLITLFACNACEYNHDNLGTHYLFDTDYSCNVVGSTGDWGFWPMDGFYMSLNQGKTIGEVLKEYTQKEYSRSFVEQSLPKLVLFGDPLLKYTGASKNHPPMIMNDFFDMEYYNGEELYIPFELSDYDSDEIVSFYNDVPLPENCLFDGNTLNWKPDESQLNKPQLFSFIVEDIRGGKYRESFVVTHSGGAISNPSFEDDPFSEESLWEIKTTTAETAEYSWEANSEHDGSRSLKITHEEAGSSELSQVVKGLVPWKEYEVSCWIKGQGVECAEVDYEGFAFYAITQANYLDWDEVIKGDFDWVQKKCVFRASPLGDAFILCRLGSEDALTSGTVWIDDFEIHPYEDIEE